MKHSSFIFQIILLTVIGIYYAAYGQSNVRFEHLTTKQGLSINSISSICQDREGFMWFGTWYGLNKFDGYTFTSFIHDPDNTKKGLLNNGINAIHEDRQGRLWVGTWQGLHLVDKATGEITPFLYQGSIAFAITVIAEDKRGNLWLGSFENLEQSNCYTKEFILYELPDGSINSIVADSSGELWIGSTSGLYKFDPERNHFTLLPLKNSPAGQSVVTAIYLDREGVLWIGTDGDGLFTIGTKNTSFKASRFNPGNLINPNATVNGIIEDNNGLLWVGSSDNGLQSINKKTNLIVTYRYDPSDPGSLNSNIIKSIYMDRTGNIWIGTPNGINKIPYSIKPFFSYQLKSTTFTRIDDNGIESVIEDRTGIIWIRTAEGIIQLDSTLKQIARFPFNPLSPEKETGDWARAVLEDRKGQVWIGTQYGLQLFNKSSGKFIEYPFKPALSFPLSYNSITEDTEGKLWIGGEGSLVSFDPVKNHYTFYQRDPNDSTSLGQDFLRGAMASNSGDIWVLTAGEGLSRLNQKTGKFKHYIPGDGASAEKLNDGDILDMYEDAEGILWVGTSQGGLNRFDPKTNTFTYFTTKDGISSNNIESIVADDKGNLWLGTNRGITRFNPKTKLATIFDESDGLPDNEFIRQAKYKRNGRLFFGNVNGLVVFNPDSIKENIQIPIIHITNLKVLGKQVQINGKEVELSYSENYLSFDFVALNYNAPEKNQYAYKLEGLDNDWDFVGERRYASYTNLNPGKYIFRIKGSNSDGVWNEKGDSITIIIQPPWWRTWIAYIFYGLCLIAGIFITDRIMRRHVINKERERSRQRELEQAHEIEKAYHELKATQAQLIHSEKMASLGELTAGIAHEIKNPLNFINNFSEVSNELIDEMNEELDNGDIKEAKEIASDIKQNLEKINHHGKRADAIVKGMLQHSRTSTGQKEPTDINALCDEYLRLAYHGLRAKDKSFNATMKTDFDESIGKINVVPQDIGRVLLNLINNAFYACSEIQHGKIVETHGSTSLHTPTVKVSTNRNGDNIIITVSDNGNGIPPEIVDKIFQPFFTTKPTGQGTGLGLSLSYDIVKAHGGEISVERYSKNETIFSINLPINQ